MWYRIFGLSEIEMSPTALQEALRAIGCEVQFHVRGDDLGWTQMELPLDPPLQINRFVTDEDEIRDRLDAWAAWLETQAHEPNHEPLMQVVISTKQMVTFRRPFDDETLETVCETLAQTMARTMRGVYQIDTRGFFAPDGTRMLVEA
jgi:hypothetical protein